MECYAASAREVKPISDTSGGVPDGEGLGDHPAR